MGRQVPGSTGRLSLAALGRGELPHTGPRGLAHGADDPCRGALEHSVNTQDLRPQDEICGSCAVPVIAWV